MLSDITNLHKTEKSWNNNFRQGTVRVGVEYDLSQIIPATQRPLRLIKAPAEHLHLSGANVCVLVLYCFVSKAESATRV
jgi:hypothetical protein